MSINERLRFFRNRKNLTQKELGILAGISFNTADVRITQYEKGYRTPKIELIEKIASILEVSPHAITTPSLDNYTDVVHVLFALEDIFGFDIKNIDKNIFSFTLDKSKDYGYNTVYNFLIQWYKKQNDFKTGIITKQKYDQWRYNYESVQNTQISIAQEKASTFPLRLKRLRENKHLSQEELAYDLNLSQQSYSKYELSKAQPTIETLIKLSSYFEVSLDYLLCKDIQ